MRSLLGDVRVTRGVALFAGGVCVAAIAIAYFFMERYLLLEPCPLCILDRFAVGALALGFFTIATFCRRAPVAAYTAWGANCFFLAAGFLFALRHQWLQNRPLDESGGCLMDTEAATTFTDFIARAFDATADCGMISWEFLGMTIPEQVVVLFFVLFMLQIFILMLFLDTRKFGCPTPPK